MTSQHHADGPTEMRPPGRAFHPPKTHHAQLPRHPVAANVLPDGRLVPFLEYSLDTHPLDTYFNGCMTTRQFRHLTGLTDITPFIGCVIQTQDGPVVYQAHHLLDDIELVTGYWNQHMNLSLKPITQLPLDVDGISALMHHMVQCLHGDTVEVDPLLTIHYLESMEPQQVETLFQNDG